VVDGHAELLGDLPVTELFHVCQDQHLGIPLVEARQRQPQSLGKFFGFDSANWIEGVIVA